MSLHPAASKEAKQEMNPPLRIVHLEDDVRDAELVRATLEAEGIQSELTRVETEPQFVAALKQRDFHLILADYTLPSFDGLSALKIAQQHAPDVPFIFVSGTLGEDVATEALKTGATDYVLKTRLTRMGPAIVRALGEAREKMERKRAEEALRRSEAYLAEAQKLTLTGNWAWDPRTDKMLYCSDELFRIYEMDRQGGFPTIEDFLQRVHPEDRDRIKERSVSGALDGIEHGADYRLLLPDGRIKHVLSIRQSISNDAGEVVEVLGTLMDISEGKRAEALFAGEKRLLEMIATGVALKEILNALCMII